MYRIIQISLNAFILSGKEEEKVYKSSDSIVRVNASLMNALTSLTLSQRSPRMIPDDVHPVMQEVHLGSGREGEIRLTERSRSGANRGSGSGSRSTGNSGACTGSGSGSGSVAGGAKSVSIMSTWFNTSSEKSSEDESSHRSEGCATGCTNYPPNASAPSFTSRTTAAPTSSKLCGICNREMVLVLGSTHTLCGECSAVLAASLAADEEDLANQDWGYQRAHPYPQPQPQQEQEQEKERELTATASTDMNLGAEGFTIDLATDLRYGSNQRKPCVQSSKRRQEQTLKQRQKFEHEGYEYDDKAAVPSQFTSKANADKRYPAVNAHRNLAGIDMKQRPRTYPAYSQLVELLQPQHIHQSSTNSSTCTVTVTSSLQTLKTLLGGVLSDMSGVISSRENDAKGGNGGRLKGDDNKGLANEKVETTMMALEGIDHARFFTDWSRRSFPRRGDALRLPDQAEEATANSIPYVSTDASDAAIKTSNRDATLPTSVHVEIVNKTRFGTTATLPCGASGQETSQTKPGVYHTGRL
jgi:hypothetical protein